MAARHGSLAKGQFGYRTPGMRVRFALTQIVDHSVSLSVVEERGWGWPTSETRRAQLIEWAVYRSAELPDGTYEPVEPFYGALPDQSMNTYVTALDDVSDLERRRLLELANSFGGVESLAIRATPEGRAFAEELQAARGSKQRRRSACRDAMVDWLYSGDAERPPGVVRNALMQDPRRNCFFAEPFSADDLDAAAAWLYRQGLVGGSMVEEAQGPVILYLTDIGVKCAEEFDSDTDGFLQSRQRLSAPAPETTTSPRTANVTYNFNAPVSGSNVAVGDSSIHRADDPKAKEPGEPSGRDSDTIVAARIGGKYAIAAAVLAAIIGTIMAAVLTKGFGLISSNSPSSGSVSSTSSPRSTLPQSSRNSSASSRTPGLPAAGPVIRIADPVNGNKNIPLNSNVTIDLVGQSVNRYVWLLVQLGDQVFPQGPCNNLSAIVTECAAVRFGDPSMGPGVRYVITAVMVDGQENNVYMSFVRNGYSFDDPPRVSVILKSKPITIYDSEQPAK